MNIKELATKLHLELVTYEDGMVSAKDYIEQIIHLCNIYFQQAVPDGWFSVEEHGLPPEGQWYDAFTYTREGERTVRELFYDSENDDGVYWLGEGDWPYPVTHWRQRPIGPEKE